MIKEQKALSPWTLFENIVRRVLKAAVPNLGLFDKIYYAKINKINIASGKVDNTDKRISTNVQILKQDLSEDENFEEVQDVSFDTNFFGSDSGVFFAPPEGTIVRIGFMYNDPCYPFIVSVTNESQDIPEFDSEGFKIFTSAGDTIFAKDGEIELRIKNGPAIKLSGSDIAWKDGSYNTTLGTIIDKILAHTHLGNLGAPTSNAQTGVPQTTSINFNTGTL